MFLHFLNLIFLASMGLANPQPNPELSSEDHFISGISFYQKGEFQSAKESFQQASTLESYNAAIYYNWGLAEMKLENWGWSVALLRRALYLSPSLKEAERALNFVKEKLTQPLSETTPEGLEYFRSQVLFKISWHLLLFLSLVLFAFSGFYLIKYFARRKMAFAEESPLPPPPKWSILSTLLFIFIAFCLGLKSLELFETKATLVSSTAQLHSGPSAEDTVLFEVFAGQELLVTKKHDDWLQVKIPGGVSGWLPEKDLFFTTENHL